MASKQGECDSGKKSGKDDLNNENNAEYNVRLDFYSEKFDPLLALRTPGIVPPVATAKTHDNVHRYISAKQKEVRNEKGGNETDKTRKLEIQTHNKDESDTRRRWLPHQLPIKRENKRPVRNIFTKMDSMRGPLSVLNNCKDNKLKIKVWTRHSHDIRGYFIGYVVAFDKHWNLALENVEEVWTRKKKRKVPALDSAVEDKTIKPKIFPPVIKIINSTKTSETCSRSIRQLMVRGEQVAYIIVLSEPI